MAEKKKLAKKKAGSAVAKANKSGKANVRTQRIEAKVKLKTNAKSYKSSRFNVSVSTANIVTRYGVVAAMDATSVQLITKPKSGSSKEAVLLLDRANIVSLEGGVGQPAKALVQEVTEVALFKDVSIKIKDGAYLLTEKDGSEITVEKRAGVEVNAVAYAE